MDDRHEEIDVFSEKISKGSEELLNDVGFNMQRQAELGKKLIAIASNEKELGQDRRAAILAMGKISDESCHEFLVRNVDMFIPVTVAIRERDQARQFPAIESLRSAGWDVIPALLRGLENDRSERALVVTESLLRDRLGGGATVKIIERQLGNAKNERHKSNIKRLMKICELASGTQATE